MTTVQLSDVYVMSPGASSWLYFTGEKPETAPNHIGGNWPVTLYHFKKGNTVYAGIYLGGNYCYTSSGIGDFDAKDTAKKLWSHYNLPLDEKPKQDIEVFEARKDAIHKTRQVFRPELMDGL